MQVMDIVNRAVMNAGIVPSFNPDEVPEDIQQRAADVLRNEIIPDMNCDRTLDMTEIAVPMIPRNGIIDLRTTPPDYPRQTFGAVPLMCRQLLTIDRFSPAPGAPVITYLRNLIDTLVDLGLIRLTGSINPYSDLEKTDAWPTDQFGTPRNIAMWSQDYKLVEVDSDFTKLYNVTETDAASMVNRRYNLPFPPMRIVDIFRATDGAALQYVHAGEFVSTEFRYAQLVYTTEDYPDCLRIRFTPSYGPAASLLILPVPIMVINSYDEPHPWEGTIVAPRKFRAYLIATLAFWMAMEYGVSTADAMKVKQNIAYQALLKNQSKHDHPQDVSRKIFNLLERGRGWRAGVNGNGYAGGFNG